MSEWKEMTLGNVADFINGRAYKATEFKEIGTPIVRIQNLTGIGNTVYSDLELPADKYIEAGDLVYAWSATFGPYIWKGPRSIYHYHIWKIQCKSIDKSYLYYYLLRTSGNFKESGNGTLFIHITKELMESFPILLPPLPEQKAIASVLSSLDDKIDLLHRQNKTLEAMAETLFRQWFQEAAPQPSPQPSPSGRGSEEWKEGKLGDVVTVVSGTTPKTDNPEFWNGDIHWTSPRDITNLIGIFLFDTERKITKRGLEQIGSGLLPANSLLMSSRAPVGALAFSEIPVAINQGYAGIVCNKGYSREFIYLWLKSNMDYVQSHANGSTFQEISKSTFRELDITIPSSDALTEFQKIIGPLFAKIRTNSVQIKTLEKLRDTLLPKLMSGEVRVKV